MIHTKSGTRLSSRSSKVAKVYIRDQALFSIPLIMRRLKTLTSTEGIPLGHSPCRTRVTGLHKEGASILCRLSLAVHLLLEQ